MTGTHDLQNRVPLRKRIIHIKIANRPTICIEIVTDDEGRIGVVEDVEI